MDAEASPSRSISGQLRGALRACRGAWRHAARLALDVALPPLCVACREPVAGDGVCAACWAKLSFIAPPYCPRLGIPFVYDPGPDLLSMEAIANPPAYARARAAVRYDDVARTLVHDPPVMIFDEPTHGVDVLTARTVVHFIRDCRARGKTVIFSTHTMREAEKL